MWAPPWKATALGLASTAQASMGPVRLLRWPHPAPTGDCGRPPCLPSQECFPRLEPSLNAQEKSQPLVLAGGPEL